MSISIIHVDENQWTQNLPAEKLTDWNNLNLNISARPGLPTYGEGFNIPSHHYPVAFKWSTEDCATLKWYPQGISGTEHATNAIDRFLVSSWYGKEQQGARLSFVNCQSGSPNYLKYGHVLLVQNMENMGTDLCDISQAEYDSYCQLNKYIPVPIHAGGVAWYKDFIYVVDTLLGIRVFNPHMIFNVPEDSETTRRCGIDSAGRLYAFGCRGIIPQIGHYKITGTDPNSFISVGEGLDSNCLWIGQYQTSGTPKLFRVFLNQDGTINTNSSIDARTPKDSDGGPLYNMQGVYRNCGDTWTCVTGKSVYKNSTARLVTQKKGASTGDRWRWPYGSEDFYLEKSVDILWCQTEYPPGSKSLGSDRYVFGVDFSTYAPDLH